MTLRESGAVSLETLYKLRHLADLLPHHTIFLFYQKRNWKVGCCPFSWEAPKSSETFNKYFDVSNISARVKNTSYAFDMHSIDIKTAYKTTMQRTDERKLTPLFCKNPMLCFAWTNRLHRFCYKIPASSSSSKASETRKPQKRLEDIWMCWKLLKACSSQIDDESWHVLKMKSRHEYRMD